MLLASVSTLPAQAEAPSLEALQVTRRSVRRDRSRGPEQFVHPHMDGSGRRRFRGTTTEYDFRRSPNSIDTVGEFNGATELNGEPAPQRNGSTERFSITGLDPNITYYIRMVTDDEADNVSGLSNQLIVSTPGS